MARALVWLLIAARSALIRSRSAWRAVGSLGVSWRPWPDAAEASASIVSAGRRLRLIVRVHIASFSIAGHTDVHAIFAVAPRCIWIKLAVAWGDDAGRIRSVHETVTIVIQTVVADLYGAGRHARASASPARVRPAGELYEVRPVRRDDRNAWRRGRIDGERDLTAVGRPGRIASVAACQLPYARSVRVHDEESVRACLTAARRARERDLGAVRRPIGAAVRRRWVIREPDNTRAVGIHHVDVRLPIAIARERDLPGVERPRGLAVRGHVAREPECAAAGRVGDVDLRVSVGDVDERELRDRRARGVELGRDRAAEGQLQPERSAGEEATVGRDLGHPQFIVPAVESAHRQAAVG